MYIREWKEESFLFFFLHIPFYIFLFEARVFKEKKKSKEEEEREGLDASFASTCRSLERPFAPAHALEQYLDGNTIVI